MGNSMQLLEKRTLCFNSNKNCELKKLRDELRLAKEKRVHFTHHLFCLQEFFLTLKLKSQEDLRIKKY